MTASNHYTKETGNLRSDSVGMAFDLIFRLSKRQVIALLTSVLSLLSACVSQSKQEVEVSTCKTWINEMSDQDRFALAGAMLREFRDGDSATISAAEPVVGPSGSTIGFFQDNIDESCRESPTDPKTIPIREIAHTIYENGTRVFGPTQR